MNHQLVYKKISFKMMAWSQIALQLISLFIFSFTIQAQPSSPPVQNVLPQSGTLNTIANSLSSGGGDGLKTTAQSMVTGNTASSVEKWLNQFGNAKVQLQVDQNGNWDDSSLDLLMPLYDNEESVLFTQLGVRSPDGRMTGNLGIGVRTFYLKNWMFGSNVFFDNDFTGNNRRVGIGAEAWRSYLKLSANTYFSTTEWHDSHDFDNYNEKPADGYDVRAEGYLPVYPQLGAKIVYEKYYGNKVALFDTDHLQSNPSAITTGLNYSPVPMVMLTVDYKKGQNALQDTQFGVNFRYELGQPWSWQINPDNIRQARSLEGNRYGLVERNNQIIMQYKKKDEQVLNALALQVIVNNSPSDGLTPNTAQVYATDSSGQPVNNIVINWTATGTTKLAATTSVTDRNGLATIEFTNTTPETIQITAHSGSISATQISQFTKVVVNNITLKITKDNSIADGQTANQALAVVTDINKRPIVNTEVTWKVDNPARLKNSQTITDSNGQVTTEFTSTAAGPIVINATAGGYTASQSSHFATNPAGIILQDIKVTKDGSPANGTDTNTAEVYVRDSGGNPVSNMTVSWSADKSGVVFTSQTMTDSAGKATVAYSDTVAESIQLTAQIANGNKLSVASVFVADVAQETISNLLVTSGALANGVTTNQATVTVVDNRNQPVPNVNVTWNIDGTAQLSATSGNTGPDGTLRVTFTDRKAETVNVKALLANGSSRTQSSTFIADASTARVATLVVTKDGSSVNSPEANTAEATVTDANGNILAGQTVSWSSDKSTVLLTPANTGLTDANGKSTVTYTDSVAETLTLTASTNGSTLSQPSSFTDDSIIAGLVVTTNNAQADGSQYNEVMATIQTPSGQALSGKNISWSVDSSTASPQNSTTTTDGNGESTLRLTDTTNENVRVTARLSNGKNSSTTVTFTRVLQLTLTPGSASGTAGYLKQLPVTAKVTDNNNHPISGITVNWNTGNSDLTVTPASGGITDNNGEVTFQFTSSSAGSFTPEASILSGTTTITRQSTLTFTEDVSAPITFTSTPAGGTVPRSEIADGIKFTVPPWAGMIKGQTLDCQYDYESDTKRLSVDVVIDDGNWGQTITLVTPGLPSADAPVNDGRLFCAYISLDGTSIQRSANVALNVTR